jgi:phage terminase large subunit-like protein
MCARNAVVTQDPAGNRKLDKAKATGRIDGMVALAMARAMAATYEDVLLPTSPWDDPEFRISF